MKRQSCLRIIIVHLVALTAMEVQAVPKLRQSTSQPIHLGPFVDASDGVTPEASIDSAIEANCYLSKDGAASALRNDVTDPIYDRNGWYTVQLNATDTNTLGELIIEVSNPSTHLPVWARYEVVPANVYDSLVAGTSMLQANVKQIDDTASAAQNLETMYDNSTESPYLFTTVDDDASDTTFGIADGPAFSNDAYNGDTILLSFSGRHYVGTITDYVSSTEDVTVVWHGQTPPVVNEQKVLIIARPRQVELSSSAVDAIWNELTSGHSTAGSFGALLADVFTETLWDAFVTGAPEYVEPPTETENAEAVWTAEERTLTGAE